MLCQTGQTNWSNHCFWSHFHAMFSQLLSSKPGMRASAARVGALAAPLSSLTQGASSVPSAHHAASLPRHPRAAPAAVGAQQLCGGGRGWGLVQPRAVALWAGAGGARSSVEIVGVGAGAFGRTQGWARGIYISPPNDDIPDNFEEDEKDDFTSK